MAVFPASTGVDGGDRIGAFCAAGRLNLVPLGVIELGLCVFGGVILLETRGFVLKSLFRVVEGGFGRDTLTEVIFEVASLGSSGEGDFFDNVFDVEVERADNPFCAFEGVVSRDDILEYSSHQFKTISYRKNQMFSRIACVFQFP